MIARFAAWFHRLMVALSIFNRLDELEKPDGRFPCGRCGGVYDVISGRTNGPRLLEQPHPTGAPAQRVLVCAWCQPIVEAKGWKRIK